jgi:hypothetical protein
LAWLALATLLGACGAKARDAEPPRASSPPIAAPSDLFPDDLDFVARIDTERLRQNAALAPLVRDLAKSSNAELLASVKDSVEQASAISIGTRWMPDGFHGDGVLAIETTAISDEREGRAASDPSRRRIPSRHVDIDIFARTARVRGEPALEIVLRSRGIVLATAAEADAVLRVLGAGPDPNRLEPPARGLVSFAGRVRSGGTIILDTAKLALLREWTEGLVSYSGSLDEGGAADRGPAIEIEAALSYATVAAAEKAVAKAKTFLARLVAAGGASGTVADSVRLTELGTSLRVRAELPFAWLAKVN